MHTSVWNVASLGRDRKLRHGQGCVRPEGLTALVRECLEVRSHGAEVSSHVRAGHGVGNPEIAYVPRGAEQ